MLRPLVDKSTSSLLSMLSLSLVIHRMLLIMQGGTSLHTHASSITQPLCHVPTEQTQLWHLKSSTLSGMTTSPSSMWKCHLKPLLQFSLISNVSPLPQLVIFSQIGAVLLEWMHLMSSALSLPSTTLTKMKSLLCPYTLEGFRFIYADSDAPLVCLLLFFHVLAEVLV